MTGSEVACTCGEHNERSAVVRCACSKLESNLAGAPEDVAPVDEVKSQAWQDLAYLPKLDETELNFAADQVNEHEVEVGAKVLDTSARALEQSTPVVRKTTGPLDTDLGFFRPDSNGFAKMPGTFALVECLGSGVNGDVCSYRRSSTKGQELVAVKKFDAAELDKQRDTETNERRVHMRLGNRRAPKAEDGLSEIGVLRYLAQQADLPLWLLRLHDVFSHGQEVWLVTELCDAGELFAEVQRFGPLPATEAQKFTWQILQATAYLHKHHIGHRDISLENILVKEGNARLMDFGMAVRSCDATGAPLRFFQELGKDFYRAPECSVPRSSDVAVFVPSGASAGEVATVEVGDEMLCEVFLPEDAIPGEWCEAKTWGYEASPADVWAVGVCAIVLLTGTPAWVKASLADEYFTYIKENGLAAVLDQWGMAPLPDDAQAFIDATTRSQSVARPSAAEGLLQDWFVSLQDEPVTLHHA